MQIAQTRRRFMSGAVMAGAAGILPPRRGWSAEPTLETTTVRFINYGVLPICLAPQSVAEALLRAEGFTDIRYVQPSDPSWLGTTEPVARGEADFDLNTPWTFVSAIEARKPITMLTGVLVGCYELFAREGIRGIADLKGKSVGAQAAGPTRIGLPSLLMASVGLNPANDVEWVLDPSVKPLELFKQGKIDAFLGFPPEPQELRARKIGDVIVNTAIDLPWSQYFCCMMYGNTDFVQRYPVATKRAMRAILKAADLCAAQPARVAKELVELGLTPRYDYALQTLSEIPYDKWREYDAEDTIRFYALRLHEAGMIKSSPQRIIAEGTDWRFLNELKRELKA
jgi:NitT/TauT family transport system substrate-binding protein